MTSAKAPERSFSTRSASGARWDWKCHTFLPGIAWALLTNFVKSYRMPESISILPALIKLGGFQYCANHGNIGDLLIDIATRQFFRRHHLPAQGNLIGHVVYGGGGRFVSFYGSLDEQKEELTARSVERCIILPHSFYQVDSLIRSFDERHLVFCREQRSLDYCLSLNERAQFLPADDMALYFCPNSLPSFILEEKGTPGLSGTMGGFPPGKNPGIRAGIFFLLHSAKITGSRGLFCRAGARRAPALPELILGRDISDLWNGWGDGSAEQAFLIGGLLSILKELTSSFQTACTSALQVCLPDAGYTSWTTTTENFPEFIVNPVRSSKSESPSSL